MMSTTNLALTFLFAVGRTSALAIKPDWPEEPKVESEELCASFKMYAFDRPDIEFLNQKRRNGKIPAESPDPSWRMEEIRGSEDERSAKNSCGSADASDIVECCFKRGHPVELTVVEPREKCVGLLGPMDPEMPVELLDKIASKMMACDTRTSLNPPISVFGQTIKKEWRNLTRKWLDRRTYLIESWGPEEETKDKRRCYDVVGNPEARGRRDSYKHADAMSWTMNRPDGSVLCGSNSYRKNGRTHRGRVTQCCNVIGRKTILRLEDDSFSKAGWGSGYLKFMDVRVHNRAAAETGKEGELRDLPPESDEDEEANSKAIVFMWGDLNSFKVGRRMANSGCVRGEVPKKGGGCRACTEKDKIAVNKDGTLKYPQC